MCEHEWKWEDDWHLNYEVSGDSILIPQVCVHCGKKAYDTRTGVLKVVGDKYHLHTANGYYIIDPDTVKRIV